MEFQLYLIALEDEIRRLLSAPDPNLGRLYSMMAYHLGWLDEQFRVARGNGGKCIRALLCLLSCAAAGVDWHRALPAAAAIELVHNFSLIHDDIEDNSHTRRGRTTVWRVWGLAHGINVGDTMLMLGRLAMGRLSERGVDATTILTAQDILDRTCLQLCHGQYLDIAWEGRLDIQEEAYLEMIGSKTAALMAASTQLGALIGGADDATEHYRQFGWQLGMAFQIVDDLLGIWGDPAITGKPAADDIRNRKMTLPVIFALRNSENGAELAEVYQTASLAEADVARAIGILERAGARNSVQRLASRYEAAALSALDATAGCRDTVDRLRSLARSMTVRLK